MKKSLIVYYSYTGNTKIIADMIKSETNFDTVELKPTIPFSSDYQEVVDEWQNNNVKRDVDIFDIDVDLSNYNNIIVCSPIWWYTITPVITKFLKKYDLTGKTIYPVVTSAGWFGHSTADIKKLCANSKVMPTLEVTFSEDYAEHKIEEFNIDFKKYVNSLK